MVDAALLAGDGNQVERFKDTVASSLVAVSAIRHMVGNLCSNSHSALQKSSVSRAVEACCT
jgi:hypothetical protein